MEAVKKSQSDTEKRRPEKHKSRHTLIDYTAVQSNPKNRSNVRQEKDSREDTLRKIREGGGSERQRERES